MAQKFISLNVVYNKIPAMNANALPEADRIVEEWGLEILHTAQRAIENPPKTGIVYERGSISHQASAPGEAPADDTGNLRNNAKIKNVGMAKRDVVFYSDYAFHLEYGHWNHGVWTYARPFLRPAIQKNKGKFFKAMNELVKNV